MKTGKSDPSTHLSADHGPMYACHLSTGGAGTRQVLCLPASNLAEKYELKVQ